jgi:hypothetical protein
MNQKLCTGNEAEKKCQCYYVFKKKSNDGSKELEYRGKHAWQYAEWAMYMKFVTRLGA